MKVKDSGCRRRAVLAMALTILAMAPLVADETPVAEQDTGKEKAEKVAVLPGRLETSELEGFDDLPAWRKKLVATSLRIGRENELNQYIFGSADPERGGFDCSGSIYYVLRECGIEPPRSSAAQFDWIKEDGALTEIPAKTAKLDDKVFEKLQPGDLLFWAGTYNPTDGRTNKITHVQMYLGREKKDGRPVMIGSSDGRSYRGKRRCGYGVFDFRLPRQGSKSRFVGFGSPPALGQR